jgi:hypothetical protein
MIVRDPSALQQVLATIFQLIFLTIGEHEYYQRLPGTNITHPSDLLLTIIKASLPESSRKLTGSMYTGCILG